MKFQIRAANIDVRVTNDNEDMLYSYQTDNLVIGLDAKALASSLFELIGSIENAKRELEKTP